MANASKQSDLDGLTIWVSCKVMTTVYDMESDTLKLVVLQECPFTPRHINEVLIIHAITEGTWIVTPTGKELWKAGDQVARKL